MSESKKIVKTAKRGDEIILPGGSYIYQSNRITNGRFPDFNIYHIKIFVCVIKQMQEAIQAEMDGKNWQQLGLFEETEDSAFIRIGIPLMEITSHSNYAEVLACFEDLRKIPVSIESPMGKNFDRITGLITEYEKPKLVNGRSVIYVNIRKPVGEQLITISKNERGKPISFTRYLYEVVMNSRSKYTWKIYTLISSWKTKGGFNITLENFRNMLGLKEEEYVNYSDLKRRIIIPAQKELDHKADCWFNCSESGFEERDGKKVVGLRFKVISPDFEKVAELKKSQAHQMLTMNVGFKKNHLEAIEAIFTPSADYGDILNKIIELIDHVKLKGKEIKEPQKYIIASLLNAYEN